MKFLLVCLVLIYASQVKAPSSGNVRLVGGSSSTNGLVEVYYRGVWGTICDNEFTERSARVVCRTAGISNADPRILPARNFPVSTLAIILTRVRCAGFESSIIRCLHNPTPPTSCQHSNDVAIDCTGDYSGGAVTVPGDTEPGHEPAPGFHVGTQLPLTVSLRSGPTTTGTSTGGVLVMSLQGSSATVHFDAFWTEKNSRVACRMLGVDMTNTYPLAVDPNFYTNRPSFPILPMYIDCQGHEADLSLCDRMTIDVTSLTHATDVAIDCMGARNMQTALVPAGKTGEIRVTFSGRSGPSCAFRGSGRQTAKVYCRMLGYGDHDGVVMTSTPLPTGTTALLSGETLCHGHEKHLAECRNIQALGETNCPLNTVAVISCVPQSPVQGIRLSGGTSTSGRVEIQYEGRWGTVCDSWFEDGGAKVFCRMLNLPCEGDETTLNECYHERWGVNRCSDGHQQDIWVTCA